jgi:integrase/recombinase XerD
LGLDIRPALVEYPRQRIVLGLFKWLSNPKISPGRVATPPPPLTTAITGDRPCLVFARFGRAALARSAGRVRFSVVRTMTVVLADAYKAYKKLRLAGRSPRTGHQYDVYLRFFDRYLERPALLTDLDDETVTAFLGWLKAGRSPATVNRARECILALWRWLARKRKVEQFPDVDRLQEYKRVPEAWSAAQIAHLVETAYRGDWGKKAPEPIGGTPANLWWAGILLFVYDTGCRIGAVLAVRVADVNLDTGRVLVRAETQKQHADQVFHLDPTTCAILREFAHGDRLFPWQMCIGSLYGHFRRLLKAAGLPHGRRDKFHRIRRTAATMAELHVGRGVATVLLGHSSAEVTKSYVDTSMMPENRVAERLPRPVLVGVQAADGSAPSADDLLPAPFMAAAPVEHRVSGIILPSPQTLAQADALMDLDPLPLAIEFCESRPCPNAKTRDVYRRALQRILAGLGARRLRDMDPAGLSRNEIGRLRSFLFWLVRAKRIYGAARICEDINPRRTKAGAA